jgi:hypothetical protein
MKRDLLKTIAAAKQLTNVIVLTHNIDFAFLQTVVLSFLRRAGQPKLTIFADAQCAAESYRFQRPLLDGLGIRYRVVPVAMTPGYRFHPKAVLLSSDEAATLFVGSGNLTFGGWRENAEIWLQYDSATNLGEFRAFQLYLERTLKRVPLRSAVAQEVFDAFDPQTRAWAADLENESPSGLLGRVADEGSLLEQMFPDDGTRNDQIFVCAPYFDEKGEALRAVSSRARKTTILCQTKRTTLSREVFSACSRSVTLRPVTCVRRTSSGEQRTAFIHAKFIAAQRGRSVVVYAGSANCTNAALVAGADRGNAELMARAEMSLAEFESAFLDEVQEDAASDLPKRSTIEFEPSIAPPFRVLAARYEAGSLRIAYSPRLAVISECSIDGRAMHFTSQEPGIVIAPCGGEPRNVVLEAKVDRQICRSAPFWVDHEVFLRATSKARNVADAIRDKIQPGRWSAGAWTEVLEVFYRHLADLPTQTALDPEQGKKRSDGKGAEHLFPIANVFAEGYQAPSFRPPAEAFGSSVGDQSLQGLLLRWFGIRVEQEETQGGTPDAAPEGDGNEGDQPRQVKPIVKPAKNVRAGRAEIERSAGFNVRKIEKVVDQIDGAMTSTEFLSQRTPSQLAGDLKLASILLRIGVRERWLPQEVFFRLTFRIWSALFFTGSPESGQGWIEYRLRTARDSKDFAAPLRSPDVAAALIGWSLAVPADAPVVELARFEFACALAVARLPWLWESTQQSEVQKELSAFLLHTRNRAESPEKVWSAAAAWWGQLLRRGHALMHVETALHGLTALDLAQQLDVARVRKGEILWQGSSGFCVVLQDSLRYGGKVPALRLQGVVSKSEFQANMTVPLEEIIEGRVRKVGAIKSAARAVMKDFLGTLRSRFATSDFDLDID